MAEVLSQSEIDALLAAVSSGNIETEAAALEAPGEAKEGSDWIAYDLTSQEKIVRGKLVALQGIHERFARIFRVTLSNSLRKNVTVGLTNIDFLKFSDYISNILLPTSLNVVQMPELGGYMLFVVSSKLTYAMVDAYYGGSERPFSKIGGREEFTAIENNMIRKVANLAIRDLQDAWKLNYPLALEFMRSESNPHFVGHIHGSEVVAVVSFEVEFENLSGPFVLIIQLKALDPIAQALIVNVTGEISTDKETWDKHWDSELGALELELRAELGVAERTLREVQSFQVGDELILHQDAAAPLTVYVGELAKFQGMMGTYRGNTAVRLTDKLNLSKKE